MFLWNKQAPRFYATKHLQLTEVYGLDYISSSLDTLFDLQILHLIL